MRRLLCLLPVLFLVIAAEFLVIAAEATAQQPKARPVTRAAAAPQSPYSPVSTVKELMDGMVIPASDAIFGAVGSTTNAAGVSEDKAPKTDADWLAVRHNALLLFEAGNLLMMNRHIATGQSAHPGAELEPAEMEALVNKDRPGFIKHAQGLMDAAQVVLKAVDARNVDGLLSAGGDLDEACENCHMTYWYPNQKK